MKLCSIDGCENPHQARGWCNKHYQRWLSWGNPMIKDPRLYDGIIGTPLFMIEPERQAVLLAQQKRYEFLMAKFIAESSN